MSAKGKITKIICFALIAILLLVCIKAQAVADWYMQAIYPIVAVILSNISGLVPFSLYDTFIAMYVLAILASIVAMLMGKLKPGKWAKYLVSSIFVIVVWFYAAWGIAYSRSDFYHRTNTTKQTFDSINFKHFLSDYIEELNNSYIADFTLDLNAVDKAIEESFSKQSEQLEIKYPGGKRRTKHMIFESWITKSGISGYFGPFFNEVHVNFFALPVDIPFTLAHEKAHQFGIASEAECNLYAYIVCTQSNNKHLKYSAYFSVLGYVLNNTRKLLPEEYKYYRSKIKQEIADQYNNNIEHWQGGINTTMSETQSKVYDTYLKTHGIQSGMANYSEMVELLVSWHINKYEK